MLMYDGELYIGNHRQQRITDQELHMYILMCIYVDVCNAESIDLLIIRHEAK